MGTKKYLLVSNSFDETTGIGRHTTSFYNFLKDKKIQQKKLTIKNYPFIAKIKNRFLQNLLFFIASTITIKDKQNYLKVSFSAIAPLNCDVVQFSSCHLYSLRYVGKLFFLKILMPQNAFYVLLEYLHYKNTGSINSFLSEVEVQRFRKVYGGTAAKCKVTYPRIHKKLLPIKKKAKFEISNQHKINVVFIAYNPILKGFKVLENLAKMDSRFNIFVIGSERLKTDQKNIINLGKISIKEVDFTKFDLFIYPSKLDSYAFVLEECTRMRLIPFFSREVGCGEIFEYKNLSDSLIISNYDHTHIYDRINSIIFNQNNLKIVTKKLEELSYKLENDDYIDYFESNLG